MNAFDQGTEDIILALENVAAEATKPLVGVFLDFHPPLMSSGEADTPGMLPRFDGSVDAIQALSALTNYACGATGTSAQCRWWKWTPKRPSCW